MSEFINSIDIYGEEEVLESIIDKTITEFNSNHVAYLGSNAFYNCKELISVNLPNATLLTGTSGSGSNLTYINNSSKVFFGCENLTNISMPKAEKIGASWFVGCKKLKNVELPMLTGLGSNAFYCSGLETLTAENLNAIGASTFALTNIQTIPNITNIHSAPQGCFRHCQKLNLPLEYFEGLYNTIYSSAFAFAKIPNNITLPNKSSNNIYRESGAFWNVGRVLTDNVETLYETNGTYFLGRSRFETVYLPNITTIPASGFGYAPFLTDLVLGTNESTEIVSLKGSATSVFNATQIVPDSSYSQYYKNNGYVYVPDHLLESYRSATNWAIISDKIKPLSQFSPTHQYDDEYIQDDWETIIDNINNGDYSSYLNKKAYLPIDGFNGVYMVCVANDTDVLSEGNGFAKTTWITEQPVGNLPLDISDDYYDVSYTNIRHKTILPNNDTGYDGSELQDLVYQIYNNRIPNIVKNSIVSVKKVTSIKGGNGFTTTDELCWVPSYYELFPPSASYEGTSAGKALGAVTYDYYRSDSNPASMDYKKQPNLGCDNAQYSYGLVYYPIRTCSSTYFYYHWGSTATYSSAPTNRLTSYVFGFCI